MATHVVITEHDPSVRSAMCNALEYNGYRVAAFADADKALHFAKANSESVDLVIAGPQAQKHLAHIELLRAAKADLDLPVVLGPDALAKQSPDISMADAVLPNDWHLDDLLRVCREVLRKEEKIDSFLAHERKRLGQTKGE